MTQPAPPRQPPQPPMTEAALVATAAALLAGVPAANVAAIAELLTAAARLYPGTPRPQRVTRQAAEYAARIVTSTPPVSTLPIGPATRAMQRLNVLRRAQYLLNAARRLTHTILANPTPQGVTGAVAKEQRYYAQHVHASNNRTQAAALADSTAQQHGKPDPTTGKPGVLLGWHAVMDDRTSTECRAAHGKNWLITAIPKIGLPGTVHPHCRCKPGPPWPTRKLVDGGQLPAIHLARR